jgi:low affinity Fe/Cu permease
VTSDDDAAARPSWRFHTSRRSHVLHRLGEWSARPTAGMAVAVVLLGWGVLGALTRFPHWWELTLYSSTSSLTVIMVFAIQHTQHREQLVTQRKLDELVRVQPEADNDLIGAETVADEELAGLVELNPRPRGDVSDGL